MKKIIFTFCITALATLTNAQDKKEYIKVIYNTDFIIDYEKIKNDIEQVKQKLESMNIIINYDKIKSMVKI